MKVFHADESVLPSASLSLVIVAGKINPAMLVGFYDPVLSFVGKWS